MQLTLCRNRRFISQYIRGLMAEWAWPSQRAKGSTCTRLAKEESECDGGCKRSEGETEEVGIGSEEEEKGGAENEGVACEALGLPPVTGAELSPCLL
jgi:hypothetical protein